MKLIKKDREIDLPITSGCLYRKELMKEHYVRLNFKDIKPNVIEVGDYVVWEGMKYTLLKPYMPEQIDIHLYQYNVELQAPEMLWKQKYFVYKDADKAPETEWNMRADAYTWMQTIIKAIKLETGADVTYLVNELIEVTQYLEIANDSIFGGLNKIAEAFDTEWWYDGDIHLGRCEQGEVKELIVGDNVNAPRVELVDDYFTRLIPLGSDRNIPQNTDAKFVNYKNRLKLNEEKYPNGYIDIEELPIEKVVPKTVIFEDIYPKSYLKISEVKSDYNEEDKQYIYSVKLKDYTLDKDDIIEGLVPVISFQDGLLNGREFELNVGEWLTLINQEEGGIIIPNDQLEPRKGDSIILANIKLPDEYIKDAQEELEYEALRIIARQKQDLNSYRISTCPVNFDIDIYVGDRVKLDNFGKVTNTRVLAVEYPLDTPSKKIITIGNNRTKGFIDRLLEEAEIDKLKAQLKKGKDGNSVTLKGKLDSTDKLPTNPKKGDSYWIGTVLYTWNGIDWVTQDLQGEHGESGSTPYIKDGFWWINGENTGFVAKGEDGKDGLKGEDGNTPYIGQNGNWWIDGQDTGIDPKGKTGAITYMAGLYNAETTYVGTATKRPLVYQPDNDLVPRVGSYYFLKNIGEFKGKSPRDNPTVWEKADEFNVILTDTLVAHFAKVGGAVFYGDLMMSQWGVDKDGNKSSNYDQYPDNFTPNLMMNFKDGSLTANKGSFGIFDIVDGSIVGREYVGGDETIRITTENMPEAVRFTPNWSITSFETILEKENYFFSRDDQTTQNTYNGSLRFNLPIEEIGEYKLASLSVYVASVVFNNSGEDASEYVKHMTSVECIIKQNGDTIKIMSGNITNTYDGIDIEFYVDKKVSCDVELNFTIDFTSTRDGAFKVGLEKYVRGVMHKNTPRQCTVIGKDGLYTSFSTLEFFHYKAGKGFTIRAGEYGFRITKDGIQKWVNGKWVTANI